MSDVEVSRERIVADLATLVAIPSIGGSTAEVDIQRGLAETWRSEGWQVEEWSLDLAHLTRRPDFPGMEVERSEAHGVLMTWPGTGGGRRLLLNGHTDVVPPGDTAAWTSEPFEPRLMLRDGRERLVGRGACDMKAGLVAAWEAMRALRDAGVTLAGDVMLAPVSGEEDGGLGTYALLHHGVHADACVIPEPTDLAIIPANGGALTFRLRIHGRATHASRRTEGVSAVEKFIPILEALRVLEAHRNADVDPLMARWPIAYPLSIGTVHAGDWASTVPDLLVAEGRLGVAIGESVEDARADLEAAVAAACARQFGVPVWCVLGVGRLLPVNVFAALVERTGLDDVPWRHDDERVPASFVDTVVGPAGGRAAAAALRDVTCPVAPELLKDRRSLD